MKLHTRPLRSWGRRWPPPIRCCRFPKILHLNLLRNQPNIKLRILLINHRDHTEFASYVPPFIPDFQVCNKDCQLNFRDSNFHSSNHTGTTLDKNQQLRTIAPIKKLFFIYYFIEENAHPVNQNIFSPCCKCKFLSCFTCILTFRMFLLYQTILQLSTTIVAKAHQRYSIQNWRCSKLTTNKRQKLFRLLPNIQ